MPFACEDPLSFAHIHGWDTFISFPAECAARRLQAHPQLRLARQLPPAARLTTCRQLLGVETPAAEAPSIRKDYRDRYQRLTGKSLQDCPVCGKGHMLRIEGMPGSLPRAPPGPDHAL